MASNKAARELPGFASPRDETLAELFKRYMTFYGVSQAALARAVGASGPSIHYLLTGVNGSGKRFMGIQRGAGDKPSLAMRVKAALNIPDDEYGRALNKTLIGYYGRRPPEQRKLWPFAVS